MLHLFFVILSFPVIHSCVNKHTKSNLSDQHLYDIVYTLYEKISYSELYTYNKKLDEINLFLSEFDSSEYKPEYFLMVQELRNELFACILSFNEFHEEIFTVESRLAELGKLQSKNHISDSVINVRLANEMDHIQNIDSRIMQIKEKTDSVLNEYLMRIQSGDHFKMNKY